MPRRPLKSIEDLMIQSHRRLQDLPSYCARCGRPIQAYPAPEPETVAVGGMLFHRECYQMYLTEQQARRAEEMRQQQAVPPAGEGPTP